MGLAMLSMDGMAQTTRQEYKDILDIQLTPGAPRRQNGCFTDMGSWMGFTLSEKEKPTAGFCGPFSIYYRNWYARSLVSLIDGTVQEQSYYPGEIRMSLKKDGADFYESLQFVDARTVVTKQGYEPPIHDFIIDSATTGEDITDSILSRPGYTFLLIAPSLAKADDSNFGDIDQIYEYAQEQGAAFYCLTASTDKDITRWRDITGAEYPFCLSDETTLKTIIRSNPGLLLLKNGTIIGKWSHNLLPQTDELTAPCLLYTSPSPRDRG